MTWASDESTVVAAGWDDVTARAWAIPSGVLLAPLPQVTLRLTHRPLVVSTACARGAYTGELKRKGEITFLCFY